MHQNAISEAELTEGQFRYGPLAYVDLKRVVPLMVGGNRRVDKTLRVIRSRRVQGKPPHTAQIESLKYLHNHVLK